MNNSKRNLTVIVMAAWIVITFGFYCWIEMDTRQNEKVLAQRTANAFFQQVVTSQLWNASHGGVYVPITTNTQPNQYLPIQGRDLSADNGLNLTRMNPSYMTRQLAELADKNGNGIQFHLTSLNPIRPENKATDWEAKWLKSFEHGIKEQGEFFDDGNTTRFRYMAPLITEPECLKCHAQQGYLEGVIRGGLSVTLPYPAHTNLHLFAGYTAVAVIGLIFIFIGGNLYERKQRLFDAAFDSPIATNVTDKNHTILMANDAYWIKFGPLQAHRKKLKCYEHRPGTSCHTADCPLTRIMDGAGKYTYETIKEMDGVSRYFIVSAKPLLDAMGKVVGIIESFQDITKRKQAEKALEESNCTLEALSNTDGLTRIANRRCFDEVLVREYARHSRSGAELSLILLDIDYFKVFNDCYGHVSGDECLRLVAQVIAGCLARPADLAARYGGEEFACILPETDCSGAVIIAEKIRQEIMARAIPHKDSKVADCVTASLGVVTMQCCAGGTVVDMITQVDEQLYRAKSAGRNQMKFTASHHTGRKVRNDLVRMT